MLWCANASKLVLFFFRVVHWGYNGIPMGISLLDSHYHKCCKTNRANDAHASIKNSPSPRFAIVAVIFITPIHHSGHCLDATAWDKLLYPLIPLPCLSVTPIPHPIPRLHLHDDPAQVQRNLSAPPRAECSCPALQITFQLASAAGAALPLRHSADTYACISLAHLSPPR